MADQPAGDEPIIKEPEAPAQTPDIAMAIIGSAGYCCTYTVVLYQAGMHGWPLGVMALGTFLTTFKRTLSPVPTKEVAA